MYAQIIDDLTSHTLVSASTLDPELRMGRWDYKTEAAKMVGELAGRRAQKIITEVIFDRIGYIYQQVKEVAEGAARLDFNLKEGIDERIDASTLDLNERVVSVVELQRL